MANIDTMQAATPSMASLDLSGIKSVKSTPAVSVTSGKSLSEIGKTAGLPVQTDISSIEGSVDFISTTDDAFTNFTNPATALGISTLAPEIIGSFDFVPLYAGDGDVNPNVYNAIYQNTLFDSLTREAARNCLQSLIKNEDDVVDTLISSVSETDSLSFSSYSEFMKALAHIGHYAYFVRRLSAAGSGLVDIGESAGWYSGYTELYFMFDSLRSALNIRDITPSSTSYYSKYYEIYGITDNQGFSISNEIGDFDSFIEVMKNVCGYTDAELTASSATRQVAQIVQDLRRSTLLFPIGASDERDSGVVDPYVVIDDMGEEDTQYACAEILGGLNALNTTSESSGLDVGVVSESDFTTFKNSLSGLEFFKRTASVCGLITRDVNLSFRKRTDTVLNDAALITGDTAGASYGSGKNPTVSTLIDDTVGNIGGDLLTSSPSSESIASLLNPAMDDGTRILSFEKFSIDPSFGINGTSGFDAFSGDLVNFLSAIEATEPNVAGISAAGFQLALNEGLAFEDFANDFKNKAEYIRQMIPVLIGGAKGSNSLWRNLTKSFANYLMKQGFSMVDSSSSSGEMLGGIGSGVTIGDSDALEFIRFGIFATAGNDSEVGYLLSKYLDLRHLAKKMSLLPTIGGNSTGALSATGTTGVTSYSTDLSIDAIENSYDQFYSAAKDLAQKIVEVNTTNDVVNGLLSATEEGDFIEGIRLYKESSTQSVSTTYDTFGGVPYNFDVDAGALAETNIDIMETPIGLALMTLVPESGNESIFDVPQIVLDGFYEDLVEKNMVSTNDIKSGVLAGTNLTTWDMMRLNRATSSAITILTPDSSEFSDEYVETLKTMNAGIETDYRGWSDALRRRAIAFIISDMISEFTDSQLLVGMDVGDFVFPTEDSSKSATKEASYAEQTESRTPSQLDGLFVGSPTGIKAVKPTAEFDTAEASLDITSNVFFKLDEAKTTQLLAIMRDLNDDSKIADEVISMVSGETTDAFDGESFTEINSQVKKTHLALLNSYYKTETLCETLYDIGTTLSSASESIRSSLTHSDSLLRVFSLLGHMASNAISNADSGTMSSDDVRSAIISTSMFPETLALRTHIDEQEYRRGARAGFFDDELSAEGVQPSSTALLIPRGSVIESGFLSKRVIPSLKLMTVKGREQQVGGATKNTPRNPISLSGDPNDDRKEIIAVGIPVGLTERLREEAASYASEIDGYSTRDYEGSPLICITIYKKDLDRGDVVYQPKSYVFDSRVMGNSSSSDTESFEETESDIISQAMAGEGDGIDENHTSQWPSLVYAGYDLDGNGSVVTEVGQSESMTMQYDGESSYSDASEYEDLFDGVIFSLFKCSPLRAHRSSEAYKAYYNLKEMFPYDAADDIRKNHLNDLLIKQYLKITAGVDVSEKAFPLFRNGTSPLSSVDGAGLGTKGKDFEFIDSMMPGLGPLFSDSFVSDDYIQTVRSDILKLIDTGIKNNILGSFDVDDSISTNVIAKLKQSYLFSAEKYFNQSHLPHLFERVFCIMIDPDGFDIDLEETTGIDTSDDAAVGSYVTEVYNIFATVQILPALSTDGLTTIRDTSASIDW